MLRNVSRFIFDISLNSKNKNLIKVCRTELAKAKSKEARERLIQVIISQRIFVDVKQNIGFKIVGS